MTAAFRRGVVGWRKVQIGGRPRVKVEEDGAGGQQRVSFAPLLLLDKPMLLKHAVSHI